MRRCGRRCPDLRPSKLALAGVQSGAHPTPSAGRLTRRRRSERHAPARRRPKKPSPAVSTSRPRKRSSSRRRLRHGCGAARATGDRQLGGPLGRADDVGEEARSRARGRARHRPRARSGTLRSRRGSRPVSPAAISGPRPAARRTRAGIWAASGGASADVDVWSPVRWRISVGTWMWGACPMSMLSSCVKCGGRAGLARAGRRSRSGTNCSSPTRLGRSTRRPAAAC